MQGNIHSSYSQTQEKKKNKEKSPSQEAMGKIIFPEA